MRLIGDFKEEKLAFAFHNYLLQQGIQNSYEAVQSGFRIWIIEEDDFDKAYAAYLLFLQNPEDPQFQLPKGPIPVPPPPPIAKAPLRVQILRRPARSPFSLTHFVILLCGVFFLWNNIQEIKILQKGGEAALQFEITPLQKKMFFDYPVYFDYLDEFLKEYPIKSLDEIKKLPPEGQECFKKLEAYPTWKGISELVVTKSLRDWIELPKGTLFGKIRQGEIWRLFTPCLLHAGFLHILFNMAWVWLLGRQIEVRLGKVKMVVLMILVGVISNVAQYLMGGPTFIGFSGIVVGMAGFIWMRQKMAPWEGYPLQRSTTIFIVVFVFAMLALELISMAMQYFQVTELSANIANTAHLVGGLAGIFLARLSFFARGHA